MTLIASQINAHLANSSWIRRMFEAGIELKAKHGAQNVFDFSLGNPDLPPPQEIGQGLHVIADTACEPMSLGYMPNSGYPAVRGLLAEALSVEQGVKVGADDIVMTCGASGGLNALFRAILEPGEEVMTIAPYFVEYGFYVGNHGGKLNVVKSLPGNFGLDLAAIKAALNDRTRAVLINSPNNPSGKVYGRGELEELAGLLKAHNSGRERPVFLIADEPYRFLAYDGVEVPAIPPLYEYTVVVSSFSKNLSMPGERVGYVLINPTMPEKGNLLAGLIFANRTLGFVNAPAIGQKLLPHALRATVDSAVYAARRRAMADVLSAAGYKFHMPEGAFYFFPEAPGGDDVAFTARLQENLILAVPGAGFGFPGHFRLAFCVAEDIIRRSGPAFKAAMP